MYKIWARMLSCAFAVSTIRKPGGGEKQGKKKRGMVIKKKKEKEK